MSHPPRGLTRKSQPIASSEWKYEVTRRIRVHGSDVRQAYYESLYSVPWHVKLIKETVALYFHERGRLHEVVVAPMHGEKAEGIPEGSRHHDNQEMDSEPSRQSCLYITLASFWYEPRNQNTSHLNLIVQCLIFKIGITNEPFSVFH